MLGLWRSEQGLQMILLSINVLRTGFKDLKQYLTFEQKNVFNLTKDD